jgi:surfeit locus 1 family protein
VRLNDYNGRFWIITIAAIIAAAVTLRLGFWQLGRAQEKLTLQASIEAQAALPVLNASSLSPTQVENVLHRSITLTGRWLPQHTLFLDNRQMNNKPGLFVLTPFEFIEPTTLRKQTILVQRGWLPRNFLDRNALPEVVTDAAAVTITGRIALSPSKLFEFKGDERGVLRQNIEIEALAKELKLELLPYALLQLDTDHSAANITQDKLLRHWAKPNYGSEKNYGYMVQWWALSALITGLYAWFQLIRPVLKSKHKANNLHND